MKPILDEVTTHKGNLGVDRKDMTIDQDSLAHIMGLLTDLYSDPAGAAIREYPSNARDSHVAADKADVPIRVTLPTTMNPTFTVQDEGVGMSVDDVLNHFSRYGWSSKRDTDDEIGMLGLGCKSALTYVSQFGMTAIKDGVRADVLIARGEGDISSVEIVDTCSTDEPNGVTVQIPVTQPTTFAMQARSFFSYWEPGTVLVDGEPPKSIRSDYAAPKEGQYWLDEDILVYAQGTNLNPDKNFHNRDVIVMGGVPYPITENKHKVRPADAHLRAVVWVPIGAVKPTPNREALIYNKRTVECLTDIRQHIEETLYRKVQELLNACGTATEALQLFTKMKSQFGALRGGGLLGQPQPYRYLQHPLPVDNRVNVPDDTYCWSIPDYDDQQRWSTATRYSTDNNGFRNHMSVDLHQLSKAAFIVGHPTKTLTTRQKLKIYTFFANKGMAGSTTFRSPYIVYIVKHMSFGQPWLEGVERYEWADIEQVKIKGEAGKLANEPTYRVLTDNDSRYSRKSTEMTLATLQGVINNRTVVYASSAWLSALDEISDVTRRLFIGSDTYLLVLMHPNRFRSFKKAVGGLSPKPTVISMDDALLRIAKDLMKANNKKNDLGIQLARYGPYWGTFADIAPKFSKEQLSEIEDPRLRRLLLKAKPASRAEMKRWENQHTCLLRIVQLVPDARLARRPASLPLATEALKLYSHKEIQQLLNHGKQRPVSPFKEFHKKYPLIERDHQYSPLPKWEDLRDYINAIHALRKRERRRQLKQETQLRAEINPESEEDAA